MSDVPDVPTIVWRPIIGALIRSLLKILGTALVTRGLLDQGAVDGVIPMLAEQLAGAVLIGAATGWSMIRAQLSHTRFAAALAVLTKEE